MVVVGGGGGGGGGGREGKWRVVRWRRGEEEVREGERREVCEGRRDR